MARRRPRPPPIRRRAGPSAPSRSAMPMSGAGPGVAHGPQEERAPSTAPASPDATRGFSVTCAVSAATPANTRPAAVNDAPSTIEPATGRSLSTRTTLTSNPTSRSAPPTTTRAAASEAWRPTGIARTSSSRPLSSSPRVSRTTSRRLMRPTKVRPTAPTWNATWPPIVSSATSGPLNASAAGLSRRGRRLVE